VQDGAGDTGPVHELVPALHIPTEFAAPGPPPSVQGGEEVVVAEAIHGVLGPEVGVEVFVPLPDVSVAVDDPRHHGLGGGSRSGGGHSSPPALFTETSARVCSYIWWPPSTRMEAPVMKSRSRAARKMTVPTRSSGFWMRFTARCMRPRSKNSWP